jgi:peptide/nickel transport system substrate-binding protein
VTDRRDFLKGLAGLQLGLLAAPSFILASTATAARAQGRDLIGVLEGPEVVTDPARIPTVFKEAPDLAQRVSAGELPPVAERIGKHPLVIAPVHEIGSYGGTMRRGFTGPGDVWNGWRTTSGPDNVLFWDYSGSTIVPNVARDWKVSEDGKTTTIHLREGMRWSDGEPFTADDFVFWFEDVYGNPDLVPFGSTYFTAGGLNGKVEKIDDLTINLVFEKPYYVLPEIMAGTNHLSGHAMQGRTGMGLFAPAHYLKPFLPKYTEQADLDAQAKAEGFDSWRTHFFFRNNWCLNPELPTVTPWTVSRAINEPTWEFVRNPYSIWVDTDGNQLPYLDKVVMTLGEDLEVVNLRAIAGEYDMQERHLDIAKLPVFLQNEEQGGYEMHLDPAAHGADVMLIFNHTYDADPEVAKWIANVDFRRALSLGIKRDELNEIFWLGMGSPSTIAPESANVYFPGEDYRLMWSTHDVPQANAMLDAIGLTEKDGDGFRLRTDGKGRLSLKIVVYAGQAMPYPQICEMIAQQWQDIGVELTVDALERNLAEARIQANEHQMHSWVGDGTEHLFSYAPQVLPITPTHYSGPLWGKWVASDGEEGVKPAEYMIEALDRFQKGLTAPDEERIELAKEIWQILIDNQHIIGTVGLSPAFYGVRVANKKLGNVPARQYNSPDVKTSSASRVMTFYYKA